MKRFLSLLLTVAMVMGMIVLPVSGISPVTGNMAVCPHCNTPWEACNWTPWVSEEEHIPSGHYFLDNDLDVTVRYLLGTKKEQTADLAVDVCLDLRGHSMTQTTDNSRIVYIYDYSTFAVMDTVGGGKLVGTCRGDPGAIYVRTNASLQLHSGALVNAQKNRLTHGGVVYVEEGATFDMRGGIVDASKVTVRSDRERSGGAIYTAGVVNISGGMVLGGSATLGGAIYVADTGELEVSGGTIMGGDALFGSTISGGASASHGGCICTAGTTRITGGLITGGYAPDDGGRGGNIYATTSGKLYISGGVIENGQAASSGGNVAAYGTAFEISGGTIRGNVYSAVNMTITGNPVINNYGYEGLILKSGKYLKIDGLTPGADIILQGSGAMTKAADSPNVAQYLENGYITPCSRYGLKVTDGVLTGSVDNNGYCPHCEKEITWQGYTADTVTSGHYYTSSATELPEGSAGLTIASGTDIVLNLISGGLMPATPYQVAGALTILSTNSSAKRVYTTAATTDVDGATFQVTGTLNLYDGVIGPAANTDTVTTGNGGVISVSARGNLNIYGGLIMGATATNGGAVYIKGTSTSKRAQFHMVSGVIRDGVATGGGGNIDIEYTNATIDGGLILDGKAKNAGNVYNDGGSAVTINGGIFAGGVATGEGGNLRHSATSSQTNMYNGLFYGGEATYGGNAYIGNGIFNMYGGTMLYGVANSGTGGNLRAYAGNYYIKKGEDPFKNYTYVGDNDTSDDIPAPQLIGGSAKTKGGNVCAYGTVKLGKCHIAGGKAKVNSNELVLGAESYFVIEPEFDSELIIGATDARLSQLENDRELANTTCTALNGKLYVENYDMAMLVKSEKNTLVLAEAALVDTATEELTWVTTAQEAVDTCDSGSYVKIYAPESTINMTGDAVVDLNGAQLTVTGEGKFYGFDSANDTFETYGSATVNGPDVEPAFLAPNGNQYVTVTEGGVTSFHRLGNDIAYVSLRPSASGMYYKGLWKFDDVLKKKVETFGIALSTEDMPGADFESDSDTLYTAFEGEEFASGETVTSVLIKDVLKEGEDNQTRGQKKVYAIPYAVVDGMTLLGRGVDYNLRWLVKAIDRCWPQCNENQREAVKKLYNANADTLSIWGLYNIEGYIQGKPAVRPLKVLTIGNSTDVDSLHMLNLVAATQGYDQELVIGLLYYSGCKIAQHVQFLQKNEPAYALYVSSTLTSDQPPARYPGYTMYDGLKYEDWDIIIIHEDDCAAHKDSVWQNDNAQILMDYIQKNKTNPDAIYGYQLPWVSPADPDLLAKYPNTPNAYENYLAQYDNDREKYYMAGVNNVSKYMLNDERFVYVIPSGTALMNASTSYLTEKDLHRDYYHASDLGRLLVSYTWYCALTGLDQLDSVDLDAIPKAFLRSTADKTQDRVLTEAEKAIIIESVNNALKNPLELTQSLITTAP